MILMVGHVALIFVNLNPLEFSGSWVHPIKTSWKSQDFWLWSWLLMNLLLVESRYPFSLEAKTSFIQSWFETCSTILLRPRVVQDATWNDWEGSTDCNLRFVWIRQSRQHGNTSWATSFASFLPHSMSTRHMWSNHKYWYLLISYNTKSQIGVLNSLVPSKKHVISRVAISALLCGFFSTIQTAGEFYHQGTTCFPHPS
jgi:hypothetical protein